MDIFTWLPDRGVNVETDLQVREVRFGDGVVQVQQKFLTPPKRKFSLTFERDAKTAAEIYRFLMKQRGNRFLWQRPDETVKVRCTELKLNETGLADTVSCVFQEEFY